MSAPRPDHLAESYPPPLEAAERAAVDQRRRANDLPLNAPLVGVALSGGGIRSATFCIGLFQALARQRLRLPAARPDTSPAPAFADARNRAPPCNRQG